MSFSGGVVKRDVSRPKRKESNCREVPKEEEVVEVVGTIGAGDGTVWGEGERGTSTETLAPSSFWSSIPCSRACNVVVGVEIEGTAGGVRCTVGYLVRPVLSSRPLL